MFFPSTSSRGRLSWLSWCWSGLFSSCDPSMAASCGFSCSGPRMAPASCPCPCHPHGRSSPGFVSPFALDLSIYNSDVDPGLVRWWGLARHGHDPCPGGRPARHRGGEVACLFCPALSATSLTALRAVQLSKMSVCSGAQQYTLHQQKFPPLRSTVGCLIQFTLRTRAPLYELMSDSWDRCVPEFLSAVLCFHDGLSASLCITCF